jgi:hypothetical protein
VIWPNDHRPPHVHAFNAEGEAVIDLAELSVREYLGMRERDVVKAVLIVAEIQEMLLAKWRKIHG